MEPGGELRLESSPSLGSSVDKPPLTGEAQGEPEKSLSESPGSQASFTQKKVSTFENRLGIVQRFQKYKLSLPAVCYGGAVKCALLMLLEMATWLKVAALIGKQLHFAYKC